MKEKKFLILKVKKISKYLRLLASWIGTGLITQNSSDESPAKYSTIKRYVYFLELSLDKSYKQFSVIIKFRGSMGIELHK